MKKSKRYQESQKTIDNKASYALKDAISLLKKMKMPKFDTSCDLHFSLNIDSKKSDQMVRGTVVLPNGVGKEVRVLVFAKGEKEKEALEAGADVVGSDDIIEKIQKGWLEFDKAIATPDMMSTVSKLGRILGPRGMMPNAKLGTVTFDLGKAVQEIKAGKIDFRVEKAGIVHAPMGKTSFGVEKLKENIAAFMDMIMRLKPPASKGSYLKSIAISTTMGPGIKIDPAFVKELVI